MGGLSLAPLVAKAKRERVEGCNRCIDVINSIIEKIAALDNKLESVIGAHINL